MSATRTEPSICRICTAHCPILVSIEDGVAVRVTGDPEAPLFGGYTCPKGRALPEQHAHPERLLHSQRRRSDGGFDPIASERAMDEIAERVSTLVELHGPRSIAMYAGTNTLPYPATGGMANGMLRALGSRMFFSANTIDQPCKQVAAALHGAWQAGYPPFRGSDAWLLMGSNPVISKAGGVGPNPGRVLKDEVKRGLSLIVLDPRRTETARRARIHLQARPGEDPTVLAGLLHVILTEGREDRAFLDAHANGVEALARAVGAFTPDYVAKRADVPAAQLIEAARILAASKRGGVTSGTGISFPTRGNLTSYLGLCLVSVCGLWPRAGDRLSKANVLLPAFEGRAQCLPPFAPSGYGEKLRVRGLGNSVAGLPTAALADEILTEGEGRVRALFCLGSNPMMAWPDQRRSFEAMKALDLLVTLDVEMSHTARLADYVIATRMSFETPGMTQQVEGLKHFGAGLGFDEPFAQYTPPLVEPPAGSDLIEDWELFYGLAQRLGLEITWVNFAGNGRHVESAPQAIPLDMQRKPTTDEIYEIMCRGSRVPLDEVKRHPHGHVFDELDTRVLPADPDCEARFELAEATMLAELAEVRAEESVRTARDLPFLLVPRRLNDFMNSGGRTNPKLGGRKPYNPAYLHPLDLEALGLAAGDVATIRSDRDAIRGIVEPDATLRRGLVSMSHCFGGNPDQEEDPRSVGSSVARLSRVDTEFDPITGIPRMGAIPVAVEPARRGEHGTNEPGSAVTSG